MSLQKCFGDLLVNYKKHIDKLLEETISAMPGSPELRQACAYALLNGGKRFRPALVLMMAKAAGREHCADQAALAVEFFHTASLIADDLPCMDDDDMRRDRPSLHCAYDEATALLVSYALIASGYELIAKNCRLLGEQGQSIALEAVEVVAYNTGLQGATGGQWLDLYPPDLKESTVRETLQKKTVSLFEISFVLGWLFGGKEIGQLPHVKRAAAHFGMAFQIADDLSDQGHDVAHGHALNLATALGQDAALVAFQREVQSYLNAIEVLGIEKEELAALAHVLLEQMPASLSV